MDIISQAYRRVAAPAREGWEEVATDRSTTERVAEADLCPTSATLARFRRAVPASAACWPVLNPSMCFAYRKLVLAGRFVAPQGIPVLARFASATAAPESAAMVQSSPSQTSPSGGSIQKTSLYT